MTDEHKSVSCKCKHMKEGFSLVEVIVAVVLLALLAVPILAYFTNAAVSSSRGKNTQKANMAAQTIVEDLNSCDTFEQIEEKISAPSTGGAVSAWSVSSPYSATTKTMELERDITVDDYTYHAVVTLDYKGDSDSYTSTSNRFNSYDEPELKEVYSKNNVVYAESDQEDEALSQFLYENPTTAAADIREGMTRTIRMTVSEGTSGAVPVYNISAWYTYEYNGSSYDASLGNNQLQVAKEFDDRVENNIYFFYNLTTKMNKEISVSTADKKEKISFDFDTSISQQEAEKLNIYFVCQKPKPDTSSGYELTMTGTGFFDKANYFTNGFKLNSVASQIVQSRFATGEIKRIAKVTVDVYDQSGSTDSLVHLETSKGE